jgi:hypothetical protein
MNGNQRVRCSAERIGANRSVIANQARRNCIDTRTLPEFFESAKS